MYDEKAYEKERGESLPAPGMPYKINSLYGKQLPHCGRYAKSKSKESREKIIKELEARQRRHEILEDAENFGKVDDELLRNAIRRRYCERD